MLDECERVRAFICVCVIANQWQGRIYEIRQPDTDGTTSVITHVCNSFIMEGIEGNLKKNITVSEKIGVLDNWQGMCKYVYEY